jgi:hypothetical protein
VERGEGESSHLTVENLLLVIGGRGVLSRSAVADLVGSGRLDEGSDRLETRVEGWFNQPDSFCPVAYDIKVDEVGRGVSLKLRSGERRGMSTLSLSLSLSLSEEMSR